MFETASRKKYRFPGPNGVVLDTEDLWTLPLTSGRGLSLNDTALLLHREIKANGDEESFVDEKPKGNKDLERKLEIVKHIINVRQTENEAAKNRASLKAKKAKILGIIAAKEDEALYNADIPALKQIISELSGLLSD